MIFPAPHFESMKHTAALALIALVAGSSPLPAGERVLFAFDDHSIPWQQNLKVTLVPEAPLTVELLDYLDWPLAGFAAMLATNGMRQEIRWPNGSALPADTRFSVKVMYPANSTARVFALYIAD